MFLGSLSSMDLVFYSFLCIYLSFAVPHGKNAKNRMLQVLNWSALKGIYDHSKNHGCFFHYSQAIMRKLKSIGLQKKKRAKTPHKEFHRSISTSIRSHTTYLHNSCGSTNNKLEVQVVEIVFNSCYF